MRNLLAASTFLFALFPLLPTGALAQNPASNATGYVRAQRPVSTSSAAAQAAFDDGLTLLYAFNPESARVAFEEAAKADPALAIAWWGVAMSYGVNINTPYLPAAQRQGNAAIKKAQSLEASASPAERALIEAASVRFAYTGAGDADRSARVYRDAMDEAARAFPQDDDIGALAAEAAMDVRPWSYYKPDGTPEAGTSEIVAHLLAVVARSPAHLQANHLLIHVLEDAPQPERALPYARRLAAMSFEPAAEHLAHMPAHTFMRVGLYHDAGVANARAIALYTTFLAANPPGHDTYFNHDCVSGVDAFMMSGESGAAHQLAVTCDGNGYGLAAETDLRFGRYTALAQFGDQDDFITGMLAAHSARVEDAQKHLVQLRKVTGAVASIEGDLLASRIAADRGDVAAQIAALEHAANAQDALGYSEPPAFWFPVREALGGAYYGAGRYAEAERTFRTDLVSNAEDPRALYGLTETLAREGRASEAEAMRARFTSAWSKADAAPDLNAL